MHLQGRVHRVQVPARGGGEAPPEGASKGGSEDRLPYRGRDGIEDEEPASSAEDIEVKRGTKVVWSSCGMPGTVQDSLRGDYLIEWASGYSQAVSGGAYWTPGEWIGVHIEVVGENGHKSTVPPLMEKEVPADLFERAFRLSLEL